MGELGDTSNKRLKINNIGDCNTTTQETSQRRKNKQQLTTVHWYFKIYSVLAGKIFSVSKTIVWVL